MRSLNTALSTLLPVATLLFVGAGLLGATTLKDLALALFIGLLTGAYSSIFVATPILAYFKEREPKYRNVRERVERDERRAAKLSAATTASEDGVGDDETTDERVPAAASTRSPSTSTAVNRRRAGSKKTTRRRRRR